MFLGPKLDYMFSEGSDLRPFAGVALGITTGSSDDTTDETSVTGFELTGRAGVRWFAVPRLSLDATLANSWGTGSAERDPDVGLTTEYDVSGINVAIVVAASGWL